MTSLWDELLYHAGAEIDVAADQAAQRFELLAARIRRAPPAEVARVHAQLEQAQATAETDLAAAVARESEARDRLRDWETRLATTRDPQLVAQLEERLASERAAISDLEAEAAEYSATVRTFEEARALLGRAR